MTGTRASAATPTLQETTAQRRGREAKEERQKQREENKEFLNRFRTLPPRERVQIWKDSNNSKHRKGIAYRIADKIQNLLIVEGTDTAPYLAQIIRNEREPYFNRYWDMKILVDMERYVSEEDLPKGAGDTLGVDELNLHGAINPFTPITGRRIGNQGWDALLWAAKEANDKWFQFFTQYELGFVEAELKALSLSEQIHRWRESVAKTKGTVGNPESFIEDALGRLIVEHAPDSLPGVLDLLNHDEDPQVQRAAIGLIREIDVFRFRLRKTQLGMSAIAAVHQAVEHRDIKLNCPSCETPAATWTEVSAQFFKDDFGLNPGTLGSYYAQMLHTLYGEDTVKIVPVGDVIKQEWAIPEINAFITSLTNKDPFFPSWEYTYCAISYSQAFHPKFRIKMDRIEESWKQFRSQHLDVSEK